MFLKITHDISVLLLLTTTKIITIVFVHLNQAEIKQILDEKLKSISQLKTSLD